MVRFKQNSKQFGVKFCNDRRDISTVKKGLFIAGIFGKVIKNKLYWRDFDTTLLSDVFGP